MRKKLLDGSAIGRYVLPFEQLDVLFKRQVTR